MKTDVHIKEDVYDRVGFMKDMNYAGEVVLKSDQISNEIRHRAKILRCVIPLTNPTLINNSNTTNSNTALKTAPD